MVGGKVSGVIGGAVSVTIVVSGAVSGALSGAVSGKVSGATVGAVIGAVGGAVSGNQRLGTLEMRNHLVLISAKQRQLVSRRQCWIAAGISNYILVDARWGS